MNVIEGRGISNVQALAEATLVEQGMPGDEVRTVLNSGDPVVVRRHLELHRERLAERLSADRGAVDLVERLLVEAPTL